MSDDSNLLIKISGDIRDYNEKLDAVKKKTEDLNESVKKIAEVSAVAFAVFSGEIFESIKAYGEAEKAQNKLSQAMQNAGIFSKDLLESYKHQAEEIQSKTGIEAAAITQAQATIQGLIGQKEVSAELTQSIVDLAAAKDMDLRSSAELIGKGIEGHIGALQRLGIQVDQGLTAQQRQEQIIKRVTVAFGGQAEATNQGIGSVRGLGAAFTSLQENIGQQFAPIFEAAVKKLTEFLELMGHNEGFVRFTAAIVAGGAALAGTLAILATATLAFLAASSAATAFGVSLTVALGPIGLIVVAVTGLAAAFGYMAVGAKKGTDSVGLLQDELERTKKRIRDLEPLSVWDERKKKQLDDAKLQLIDIEERMRKFNASAKHGDESAGQDPEKKAAADKAAAEKRDREAREQAALRAHLTILKQQALGASQETIALAQQEGSILVEIASEKNKSILDSLKLRLKMVQEQMALQAGVEEQAALTEEQRLNELRDNLLANNAEYHQLTSVEQTKFFNENQAAITTQLQVERTARQQAALDRLNLQVTEHNEFLKNQLKFGTAYALINKLMHSEIFTGSKNALTDLAAMTQSKNATLKEIGKAASVANIAIKTAESAMNVYAGFSMIPIVGQALGIAAAAAVIAFGAEQANTVLAANSGGIVTGGRAGVDSVPAMLTPGELVVPEQSFEEVIGAVADRRTGTGSGGPDGGYAHIVLELKNDLMDFVETKLVERKRLGISLQGA